MAQIVHQDGNESGRWLCGLAYVTYRTYPGHAVTCRACLRILNPPAADDQLRPSQFDGWSNRARSLTDDQLRAECDRRGVKLVTACTHGTQSGMGWNCSCGESGETAGATECIEEMASHMLVKGCRPPRGGPSARRLSASMLGDDDLRAECERRFPSGFGQVHETTLRERDEWKRRAEAAEGDLKVALANNEAIAQTHLAWLENGSPYAQERGPGIDTRPDNSIAHLPEDLLCDDV